MPWEMVDEGWGRRAADFATLFEPATCREYIAVHHRLGIAEGDRLLDVACGSGPRSSWRGSAAHPAPASTHPPG